MNCEGSRVAVGRNARAVSGRTQLTCLDDEHTDQHSRLNLLGHQNSAPRVTLHDVSVPIPVDVLWPGRALQWRYRRAGSVDPARRSPSQTRGPLQQSKHVASLASKLTQIDGCKEELSSHAMIGLRRHRATNCSSPRRRVVTCSRCKSCDSSASLDYDVSRRV